MDIETGLCPPITNYTMVARVFGRGVASSSKEHDVRVFGPHPLRRAFVP